MHFPTLSPLQSRFAACLGTSILLLIIYYSLSPSHFAYAAELDSIHNQDHNHHRIPQGHGLDLANDIDWGDDEMDLDSPPSGGTAQYQAGFLGLSRDIIGRALEDTFALKNNVPNELNVSPGEVKYYVFENSSVWGSATAWRTGLPTNISRGDQEVIWKRDEKSALEEHRDERMMEKREDEYEIGMEDGRIIKRQSGASKMVYISANTCLQPGSNDTDAVVPQLTLYVSTTDQNPKPGPGQPDTLQTAFPLVEGYVEAKVNATGNVFASVAAPNVTSKFSGGWNYQIAASIDASYYYYNDTTSFIWTIDTDSKSALIATYNLTSEDDSDETRALREQWMKIPVPFSMFVYNQSTPLVNGLRNSFCGLDKLDFEEIKIERNMTARGMGSNPKQQFYISGLAPGQKYTSVLTYNGVNRSADQGPGVVGGGGQLWKAMNFTTKTDGNCRVIFDLPFCTDVAYAVPTNPENSTLDSAQILAQTYDNYTQALYQNFTYSLQQIPCDTTNSAQYSLARNCTDCARDYKTWLCAVTIPRCTDFSTNSTFLAPRNVGKPFPNNTSPDLSSFGLNSSLTTTIHTNSSRNPYIDSVIKPGPYKELLPCKELCYDMVQSCPMALGFACPRQGSYLRMSYGSFDPRAIARDDENAITCNYLGVDWPTLSAASGLRPSSGFMGVAGIVMGIYLLGC